MGIVRGDRIGESRKLNGVSVEAQTFYAAFVASVPDDFGRFRVSPSHVAVRMYPRREPTPKILRMVDRMMVELEGAGSWSTWEVDGVTFGEVAGWQPTGNLYHRTPEPPGSTHSHSKRCATTAIARAMEWGQREEGERLRLWLSELRRTEAEQKSNRGRAEGGAKVEHPSPPSPPSPSSPPSLQRTTDNGLPVAAQPVPKPAPRKPAKPRETSWLTAYCEAWTDRWGAESLPPVGEMLRPLAAAEKALKGDRMECVARWRRFLGAAERAEWARPARFAEGLGQWGGDGVAPPTSSPGRRMTAAEVTTNAVRELIAEERAKKAGLL